MKGMRILVALDGSRRAETVLPKAIELVRQNPGAKVVVVRAVDPATLHREGVSEARVTAINEAAEYLGDVAAQLRNADVGPVGRFVWYSAAGVAIVELARAVKPDVIVMAAHRRNAAGSLVPGSIAEFVWHRTQMPILLVAGGDTPAGTDAQVSMAGEPEMKEMKRAEPGELVTEPATGEHVLVRTALPLSTQVQAVRHAVDFLCHDAGKENTA